MNGKWYVVNTKLKKEALVERQLAEKDIPCFCPLICDIRLDPSGNRQVLNPLFPCYLFVRVSERELSAVRWLPGVKRLVGNGDVPVPVEEGAVEFLKSRSDGCNVIKRKTFSRGERVRVRKGLFKGLAGMIESDLSPAERVRVLISLVNYQASIELHGAFLERE